MSGPNTAEGWVLKLARERPDLTPSELHVLITLAARHNRDFGGAHPKLELLHRETHISPRQLVRIINALEDPQRVDGQVLHVSYGPLPGLNRAGNPIYGSVYRFVGFDPIPESASPRRRNVVDTRPKASDAMSHGPSDTMSHEAGDTGAAGYVPPEQGAGDTGDAGYVTSARLPLYPVRNPASSAEEEKNPDLNPARLRARFATQANGDGDGRATARDDPDAFASEVWRGVLHRLQVSMGAAHFDQYVRGTRGVRFDVDALVLFVAPTNPFHVPWLEGKLNGAIAAAVAEEVGSPVRVEWLGPPPSQQQRRQQRPAPLLGPLSPPEERSP